MFGTRGNVMPIAVTTGVGPNGRQTVWYQRPDDEDNSMIDPVLLQTQVAAPSSPRTSLPTLAAVESEATIPQIELEPTTPPNCGPVAMFGADRTNMVTTGRPQPSAALRVAQECAKVITMVPKK